MLETGYVDRLQAFDPDAVGGLRLTGRVLGASGLSVEVSGIARHAGLGSRLLMLGTGAKPVHAEVVSFRHGVARAMAFDELDGVGPGSRVHLLTGGGLEGELADGLAAEKSWTGHGTAFPGLPGGRAGTPARAASGAQAGATLRSAGVLRASADWLGRIVDPLGRPLDGKGPLARGRPRPVRASPPAPAERARLGAPIDLGVRALDLFTTMRSGQRMGLFAGSGVGKSTLMAMLARQARCDVAVIALVGERGREVREFVEDDLGAEGLARSVVVTATSDAQPLMRREAAYAAMTIAETFRDQGLSVLLMMDSVTRFCLALREIGLSAGEPPATRGYPPSVFAELPRLLERAGPGRWRASDGLAGGAVERIVGDADGGDGIGREAGGRDAIGGDAEGRDAARVAAGRNDRGAGCGWVPGGSITALFTVLVEGDDHNEPVADAVRGILDGHVVLDRRIGEGGRFPAIDVLRSLSRAGGCLAPEDAALVKRARAILSRWNDMADMVRLGAYRAGSDAQTDEAILVAPLIEAVLAQDRTEASDLQGALALLRQAMGARDAA